MSELVELTDEIKNELSKLQAACDRSSKSQALGACYPIDNWLISVIAAWAKENNGENSSAPIDYSGYRQKAFKNVALSAVEAIRERRKSAEFYNVRSFRDKTLDDSSIEALARNFCELQGTEWTNIESIIKSGVNAKIDGFPGDFVRILIEMKPDIEKALDEAEQASGIGAAESYNWCCAIIAAYCSTPEAVSSFITETMSKYTDRWRIDGTKEYFPYSQDNKSHKKDRKGKKWASINTALEKYDEEFYNRSNPQRYIKYNGNYYEVERESYGSEKGGVDHDDKFVKLLEMPEGQEVYLDSEKVDSWYKKEADGSYVETFDIQHYSFDTTYSNSLGAKGSPELMNYVYKNLKEEGLLHTKEELRIYGLGIDCSGFVSRAIVDVMIALRIPPKEQFKTIGHGYGRLKTNATTLREYGNDGGSKKLFEFNTKGFKKGTISSEPKGQFQNCFRPGDIISVKKFSAGGKIQNDDYHILIIKDVTDKTIDVWQSHSPNTGVMGTVYKSLSGLKTTYKPKELDGGYTKNLEFARPKIFEDLNKLIPYYVDYVERGEDYVVSGPGFSIS